MATAYQYQVSAKWMGGRGGVLRSEATAAPVDFSAPPEFKGEGGRWTPEHLLAAAVASCFVATFCGMAEASRFGYEALDVAVRGTLTKDENGLRFTAMLLKPTLIVGKAEQIEQGRRLLEKAERACLIARSLACGTTMEPVIQATEKAPVT
jgi:peroxiredoxin-like protein